MQNEINTDLVIADFIESNKLDKSFRKTALDWFVPLAKQIIMHHNSAKVAFFVGINGCQGVGKSTMTDFVQQYISQTTSLNVLSISLDDFYLSKHDRDSLALKVHPLLSTRGVPGTHDTAKMQEIFELLATKSTGFTIPRFNKATDNPVDPALWFEVTEPYDIILMEGWCWGVEAQSKAELVAPINELERVEDEQGLWRSFVNTQLLKYYQPLYDVMDYWVMLKAPSFSCVLNWRLEQEHKLIASISGNSQNMQGIMTDKQIAKFIQFYQRLTEHGLETLANKCDLVFSLDKSRTISLSKGQL